jgi:hypothetical protein
VAETVERGVDDREVVGVGEMLHTQGTQVTPSPSTPSTMPALSGGTIDIFLLSGSISCSPGISFTPRILELSSTAPQNFETTAVYVLFNYSSSAAQFSSLSTVWLRYNPYLVTVVGSYHPAL